MKTPWTLQDGWLILQKRINNCIIYTLFVQHGISDKYVVDMAIQVILKIGIFALEYGEWHAKPDNQRIWSTLKVFMKEKWKLKKITSNAAGQFGFGISTTTDGDNNKKIDETYANSMANFSAGHANTTSTISWLKSTNAQQATTTTQQQQQLMMMQQ